MEDEGHLEDTRCIRRGSKNRSFSLLFDIKCWQHMTGLKLGIGVCQGHSEQHRCLPKLPLKIQGSEAIRKPNLGFYNFYYMYVILLKLVIWECHIIPINLIIRKKYWRQ